MQVSAVPEVRVPVHCHLNWFSRASHAGTRWSSTRPTSPSRSAFSSAAVQSLTFLFRAAIPGSVHQGPPRRQAFVCHHSQVAPVSLRHAFIMCLLQRQDSVQRLRGRQGDRRGQEVQGGGSRHQSGMFLSVCSVFSQVHCWFVLQTQEGPIFPPDRVYVELVAAGVEDKVILFEQLCADQFACTGGQFGDRAKYQIHLQALIARR